jgi:hypothetical protein
MEIQDDEMSSLSPILCRIPQAATMISRCERFIYEAIATGQIEAVKSNKRTLVVVESLYRYAAALPRAKIKPLVRRTRAGTNVTASRSASLASTRPGRD